MPFNLRQAVDGVGKDTQWALWRVLQHAGVFRLGRVASAAAHRAATYHVALDFGSRAVEQMSFNSLTAALHRLLSPEDVRALYTRHYAKRILAEAQCSTPVLAAADEPAVALIRRQLAAPMDDTNLAA
jgi:hypothetical protein